MRKKYTNRRITIQVRNTVALPHRAKVTRTMLRDLSMVFGELFADENFVTLLQAESRTMIPEYLRTVLHEAKTRHDIA
jgi:hypothetical protein